MHALYQLIHSLFQSLPEMALFLALALGYGAGNLRMGKFQLGPVAATLLMAFLLSQFGVQINDTLKNVLFALFIFAVGYTGGPLFFRALGKHSFKEFGLACIMALSSLATVVVLARLFHLDKGLAAGIAAGGLTQSTIMGTAQATINSLNLGPEATAQMINNMSVGYGITYIFGSFVTIFICVNVLQKFLGRTIRDDAIKAEALAYNDSVMLGEGEIDVLPELVGRIFQAGKSAGKTIVQLEQEAGEPPLTVERIKRGEVELTVTPETLLQEGDKLLVFGQPPAIAIAHTLLGEELSGEDGLSLAIQSRQIMVTNDQLATRCLIDIVRNAHTATRHGVYLVSISRKGEPIDINVNTEIERGDVVTLYGAKQDIARIASLIGTMVTGGNRTDVAYISLGLVLGLFLGHAVLRAGHIPASLGSGGGALISGLFFGWLHSRQLTMGALPSAAAQILKDFGLAGFVAIVGLNYGQEAVAAIKTQGWTILGLGALVTIIPLLVTMAVGRYILKYDNAALFAGALAGSTSASPAFGEVLNLAGNSVPTLPFTLTYVLANVFLTLLGPLVVMLV